MKILLAISEAPPIQSGFARIADRLSSGFRDAGHEVDILSVREAGRISLGEMRLTGLLPRWRDLRKRLEHVEIALVLGPTPTFSDALLALLRLRRNRPALAYTHVYDIDLPGLGPLCGAYNWIHRRMARLADRVVVATPDYGSSFEPGVSAERIHVIPWGIDPPPEENPATRGEPFTVSYVGQLRYYKGVSTLIRAARELPEIRFIVAGNGPRRKRLERRARRYRLPNLEFRRDVSDRQLRDLYRQSHVVVLPSVSRLEAFGLVLVEGMACGCVPVASSLLGVRHVVDEVGLTFPPGDAAALARALSGLAEDIGEWQRRSDRAYQHSRQYRWQHTVAGYLELFQSLLEPPEIKKPRGEAARRAPD